MKIKKLVAGCCLLLVMVDAGAQVDNDDCAGALSQGVGILPSQSTSCLLISPMGYLIEDSTTAALVDFPYPMIPYDCVGFDPTLAVPGKDRWYAVRVNCELAYTIQSSDTCSLSFWSGGDCAQLEPIGCQTVLPGITITGIVATTTQLPAMDTLLLQVSSLGPSRDISYRICLTDPFPACVSIPTSWNGGTPNICFQYTAESTPATEIGSTDGTATITMVAGNGPYTIVWEDGVQGALHADLTSGVHGFEITDADGCVQADSVTVGFGIITAIESTDVPVHFMFDRVSMSLTLQADVLGESTVTVHDAIGRLERRVKVMSNDVRIDLNALPSGVHLVVWRSHAAMTTYKLFLP